jgi:ComF family protein
MSTPSTLFASVLNKDEKEAAENEGSLKSIEFYYTTMQQAIKMFTSFVTHALFRTRPTEKLVEALTLTDLENLARYDGTLPYSEPQVRALVWEVKYYAEGHASKIAGEYLAQLLLAEASDIIGIPLLIPMPMHPKRRKERGHNQTEVLCDCALRSLSEVGGGTFSYDPSVLTRTRHTKPQQGLERHNRLKNLKNAMAVSDASKVKGRVCIVVDDVSTTGASFAEAKRALKEAGASEVRCIALAQS